MDTFEQLLNVYHDRKQVLKDQIMKKVFDEVPGLIGNRYTQETLYAEITRLDQNSITFTGSCFEMKIHLRERMSGRLNVKHHIISLGSQMDFNSLKKGNKGVDSEIINIHENIERYYKDLKRAALIISSIQNNMSHIASAVAAFYQTSIKDIEKETRS